MLSVMWWCGANHFRSISRTASLPQREGRAARRRTPVTKVETYSEFNR